MATAMDTRNYIWVDESFFRQSKYISRCHALDYNPMNRSLMLDAREYEEATRREQVESQYYGINGMSTVQMNIDPNTTSSWNEQRIVYSGTNPFQEPSKPKEKKVSKQIRHQFLRKRLLERQVK